MKTLLFLLLMIRVCLADDNIILESKSFKQDYSTKNYDCIFFGDNIGKLCGLSKDKLTFEGNAEESAKIFFKYVILEYNGNCKENKK